MPGDLRIAATVLPLILLTGCMGNGDPSHDGIFWNEKAAQARQADLSNQSRISWSQADAITSQNVSLRSRLASRRKTLSDLMSRLTNLENNPDPRISAKASSLKQTCSLATSSNDPDKIDSIISSIESQMKGLE